MIYDDDDDDGEEDQDKDEDKDEDEGWRRQVFIVFLLFPSP